MGKPPMPFVQRLLFHLDAELIDSLDSLLVSLLPLAWRGIFFPTSVIAKKSVSLGLHPQLVQAQMRALRMQLNPHLLFNTMNGISPTRLMQTDVAAADLMLEQLSRFLRITLHRGEALFIPLSDEMEFIEMCLAMQDRRLAGRVRQQMNVDPSTSTMPGVPR